MLLAGGVIAGSAAFAGCANGAPTTGPTATTAAPTPSAAPATAEATDAPTATPDSVEPTLAAIEATFEPADTAPEGAIEVKLTLAPAPVFIPAEVSATAGDIVLFLNNPTGAASPEQHNFKIGPKLQEQQAGSPDIRPGEAGVFTMSDVPAGRYIYWCTVSAHFIAGMRGVLTVTP